MRDVFVRGVGMSGFRKQPDQGPEDLTWCAVTEALEDGGIRRSALESAFVGNVYLGMGAGQRVLKGVGISGIPIMNVENACSSGSTAFHLAWLAVAAGQHDNALALGVEQLSVLGGGGIPLSTEDPEIASGLTMPGLYAMRARRHMEEFGTTVEQLAKISVKNHRNGSSNPKAQYQRAITLADVLSSRPIADPLKLYDCCPTGDGAAAAVVTALKPDGPCIRVRASVVLSGSWRNDARDMTTSELSMRAARLAYEQAAVGPDDIDVAEVHDAFTIGELMYYEALGFCEIGAGGALVDDGATEISGRIPVNASGGLLSKGHPLGATGIAQIVEIADQLRGRSGARQVGGARVGLTHCTGGGVAGFDHIACSIHVLERV